MSVNLLVIIFFAVLGVLVISVIYEFKRTYRDEDYWK